MSTRVDRDGNFMSYFKKRRKLIFHNTTEALFHYRLWSSIASEGIGLSRSPSPLYRFYVGCVPPHMLWFRISEVRKSKFCVWARLVKWSDEMCAPQHVKNLSVCRRPQWLRNNWGTDRCNAPGVVLWAWKSLRHHGDVVYRYRGYSWYTSDVIMVDVDAMAPNKCQAISNHHADLTMNSLRDRDIML